ncbi:rhodanese-like domain-containing protein [bacterium]|nr:rhodanese-like domain-containing protein [bacterium]
MIGRRKLLTGGALLALGSVGFVAADGQNLFYAALAEDVPGGTLSVDQAHTQAVSGQITLIDIRRPDEWEKTGSGEGAVRLDMRRTDFIPALTKIVDGNLGAPVALICARGVRSSRMTNQLISAGFTNIINVPEGMLGSAAGPGWLKRGLPIVKDN